MPPRDWPNTAGFLCCLITLTLALAFGVALLPREGSDPPPSVTATTPFFVTDTVLASQPPATVAPSLVSFSIQASNSRVGAHLRPAPRVCLALRSPGVAVAVVEPVQLDGTLVRVTDASGCATFNDLSISAAGTFRLQAAAHGVGTVQGASFLVRV